MHSYCSLCDAQVTALFEGGVCKDCVEVAIKPEEEPTTTVVPAETLVIPLSHSKTETIKIYEPNQRPIQ